MHYQTGVQTRRAVARGLGKRVMDDAGQSAPGDDAVNDASMRSAVNILIVAKPAAGAGSAPSVFTCVYHRAW